MGDKTKISWTDASWNPIRGCTRVSEGCRHCYAERHAGRFSGKGQPYEGVITIKPRRQMQVDASGEPTGKFRSLGNRAYWNGEVLFVAEHLADPLKWKKPRRIFVDSMSDLFHDGFTNEQIAAVFGVMAAAPQHTFQVLTKRAKRMREWFEWVVGHGARTCAKEALLHLGGVHDCPWEAAICVDWRWPLPNVWIGVSVENQAAADERIPELLRAPAAVRFLSCEPLLGPVSLGLSLGVGLAEAERWTGTLPILDWVIAGCESGAGARPCDGGWLRSLRNHCSSAEVAFFLKQARLGDGIDFGPGSKRKAGGVIELPYLDGIQHAAFPEVFHEG